MWDTYRLSTWGNFSLRKIALLFAAVVMSALFMALAHSTPTFAEGATWDGDNIKLGSEVYTKLATPPSVIPGILSTNTTIYQSGTSGTVKIIAVSSDDKTKEITDAQTGSFTVDSNGNYLTLPGVDPPVTTLSIAASTGPAGSTGGTTSCDVGSIGWIICPVSRFIAGGMDKIYEWVSDFLTVKPMTSDTNSGLYQAWEIVRGLANACFIIAFLFIIYAQITNYGISNYEIKKMIPKLIIVAVLVNISYFVCAIAVDVSNILGDSVQNAFIEVRNALPDPAPQIQWSALTENILSGGAIVGGLGGLALAIYNAPALVALLLPILALGALSSLVALLVLAARQALIIVLVVIAPLAFVAFLLPNTEKLFEKWRGLFMTMLMVFPMFALLFGGSQLASSIILQSTDKITVVIFALFVQVAPLALTPFLVKFSGSLLGRLAGMVNNPSKGLVDRTRNWANDRADTMRKAQELRGKSKAAWTPSGYAYRRGSNKRFREGRKKLYETRLAASDMSQERFQDMLSHTKQAELEQAAGTATGERKYEDAIARSDTLKTYKSTQWLEQQRVKQHHAHEEALQHEALTKHISPASHPNNYYAVSASEARIALRGQKIAEGRSMFAQSEQSDEWAKLVISNENLQTEIGGVGGKDRALARATSEFRKNYGERIGEGKAVMDHYNLSAEQRQAHALGQTVGSADAYGNFKIFHKDSVYTRDAAVDTQVRQGTVKELHEIIRESGGSLSDYSTTIASAIAEGGISKKAIYTGGQSVDLIGHGKVSGQSGLDQITLNTILKGKIGAADLATMDADAIAQLLRVAGSRTIRNALAPAQQAEFDTKVQAMQQAAYVALTNTSINGNVKDNSRTYLNGMIKNLSGTLYEPDGSAATIDPGRKY